MGSLITADAWLTTMAATSQQHAIVATKLLRTQILVRNRIGHDIPLNTEYLRRRIIHAARYGHVADCSVACGRCGTQATLTNWVAVADLDASERLLALKELWRKVDKERLAYMAPCPGEEYAADVAASDALPSVRKPR